MITPPEEAVGRSEAFLDCLESLARLARLERPVLLIGERGTGKELAAQRLHYLSPRWQGPLVTLNCAALHPGVLESELFGHEAGAFTGAVSRRKGRFELADGGALFLDEIGHMPRAVQRKLLRVVEYQTFERLGGGTPLRVDVRLIAATNQDLPSLAARGRFAPDLLDRLAFEVATLPPLRHRGEDILLLAEHFAWRMALELGGEPPRFSSRALAALQHHPWPGNVRELKSCVERSVARAMAEGAAMVPDLTLDPFESPWRPRGEPEPQGRGETTAPATRLPSQPPCRLPCHLPDMVAALEREAVAAAMAEARGHQGEAARLLGLGYHQFRRLMARRRPGGSATATPRAGDSPGPD